MSFAAGAVVHKIAAELQRALKTWGSVGFHKGLPTVKDIPLIIKALSLSAPGVADEAHSALVWLSGQDLGRDPRAWQAWWNTYGAELARREADEKAARDLFLALKCDILTGCWEAIEGTLSSRLRERAAPGEIQRFMKSSARLLRKAYRDAEVKELRLEADSGTLTVDWGKSGFEFTEIALVREDGAWKFARTPWGRRLVRQARRQLKTNALPPRVRHQESVFGDDDDVVNWAALVFGGMFFAFAFALIFFLTPWYVSLPLGAAFAASMTYVLSCSRHRKCRRRAAVRRGRTSRTT